MVDVVCKSVGKYVFGLYFGIFFLYCADVPKRVNRASGVTIYREKEKIEVCCQLARVLF